MPADCSLRCQKQPNSSKGVDVTVCKLKWSHDKSGLFERNLNLSENLTEIERTRSLIEDDVNEAVSVFTAALSKVASCLVKKNSGKKVFSNEWYDKECRDMRRTTRKALRKFSRSRLNFDRDFYCELRKQYKHLLLTKEKEYKLKCRKELESNIRDPKQFWRNVKKFTTKTRQVSDTSDEQWLEHFKRVFDVKGMEQDTGDEMSSSYTTESNRNSYAEDDFLNSDIRPQEVTESIDHLKANKVAGLDGIIPEVFKHSCDKIIPFLVHRFGTVFTSGVYPEAWTEAVIYPLHKKSSIHEPDNYRGISLLNGCSKPYSYIINKRLSRWVEDNDLLGGIQAGFRKDH